MNISLYITNYVQHGSEDVMAAKKSIESSQRLVLLCFISRRNQICLIFNVLVRCIHFLLSTVENCLLLKERNSLETAYCFIYSQPITDQGVEAVKRHSNKYDIFISYAHADSETVAYIIKVLTEDIPDIKLFVDRQELHTGKF